ncbi:glycosyltransferase involved in cell wall biosynthesis [Nocardiopsis arvandica]|uniref:Glycosyltransferase involved in cell wall biosynthesis n=1 Tax=Nocardiopsis sinuspersici TaxID=501010 RepID=A0A7Z0BMY2_9ACTN|nr:glycosyltransferase involved in cell wall biosynthesis [Nocardiopsis sinuspersici]
MTTVVVVPPDSVPSGGNTYDRRLAGALTGLGRPVRRIVVHGDWPRADAGARAGLSRVLAEVPDGATAVLDGLVACGVPEVLLPHASRLRLVVLVHLPLAEGSGLSPEAARDLDARERRVLRAAAAVVATSRWSARRVAGHHGLDRVHVVEPGVDPAPLAPGGDGTRLLCVASLTPRKGHDLLLAALARLDSLEWECSCVGPVGDLSADTGASAAYARYLRALCRDLGLQGRVSFAGDLRGEGLSAAYARSDLLVLPSRGETYGMVVTEALAHGVPVVAGEVGGVPEALGRDPRGERPGVLVPPGDASALAEALRRWLTREDLRGQLRCSARLRREGLAGWERAARDMAAVLDHGEPR